MAAVAVAPMVTADKQQLAFLLAGAPGVSFCLTDILASSCMTTVFHKTAALVDRLSWNWNAEMRLPGRSGRRTTISLGRQGS